jgi:glucokinase
MKPKLLVGVDLGGTNVRAAVVDPGGKIHGAARSRLSGDRSADVVVALTSQCVREALGAAGVALEDLSGVGIGVAGQLRGDSGVVANGPNLGWREVPFGPKMSAALGVPVRIFNDLKAITWGEVLCGAARSFKDVLVVFVGTGVGSGMVVGGRMAWGATGVVAEIGHVKVRPGGEPCGCGQRGCLEAYLGGGNLTARLRREAAQDWPALLESAGGKAGEIHPGKLEELVQAGDARAVALYEELAGMFGLVLANAVTLLNPAALLLGGTVLKGCPTLRQRSELVLKEQVLAVAGENLKILEPALGDDGGIVGAALLALPGEPIG